MDHICSLKSMFRSIVFLHLHATLFLKVQLFWSTVLRSSCFQTMYESHDVSCFSSIQDSLNHYFNVGFLEVYDEPNTRFQVLTFKLLLYAKMILLIFLWFRRFVILYMMKSIILLQKIKIVWSKNKEWLWFAFWTFFCNHISR